MEQFRFGMEYLRVTQGYGLYDDGRVIADSTSSHDGSYGLDLGGQSGATNDYWRTGCTLEVCRVYGSYNATWFTNVNEVQIATGEIRPPRSLVLMLIHANNSTIKELGIKPGKIFYPGDKIYREGSGGGVAAHIHCEVGEGPFTGTGWHKNGYTSSYGVVWEINKKLKPHEILIVGDDVEIKPTVGTYFPYKWTLRSEVKENSKPKDYTHPDYSPIVSHGIDVSKFQTIANPDEINLDKYDFVIARAVHTAKGQIKPQPDAAFEQHIQFAQERGKHTGAYIYTYAFNEDEAELEIQAFLEAVKNVRDGLDFPIFIDYEDKIIAPLGKAVNRRLLDYFVRRLREEGFPSVGVYTYTNWVSNINISDFSGPVWIADYRGSCGYKGRVDIWQYGGDTIPGYYPTNIDANNCYSDLVIRPIEADVTAHIVKSYIEYFFEKDPYKIAGKLYRGEKYPVTFYEEDVTVLYNQYPGHWAKIAKDNREYWIFIFNEIEDVELIKKEPPIDENEELLKEIEQLKATIVQKEQEIEALQSSKSELEQTVNKQKEDYQVLQNRINEAVKVLMPIE